MENPIVEKILKEDVLWQIDDDGYFLHSDCDDGEKSASSSKKVRIKTEPVSDEKYEGTVVNTEIDTSGSTSTVSKQKLQRSRGSYCVAFGCNKRKAIKRLRSDSEGSDDEESLAKRKFPRTFHMFPKDISRRSLWIAKCRRKNWLPTQYSLLCSDHFKEKDLDRTGQTVRVREDAVPSRFKKFPKYFHEDTTSRKLPACRTSANDEVVMPNEVETCQKNSISPVIHDHSYSSSMSPHKLVKKIEIKTEQLKIVRKKLKVSNQKSKRMKIVVRNMRTVIKSLKRKNLITASCEELLLQSNGI